MLFCFWSKSSSLLEEPRAAPILCDRVPGDAAMESTEAIAGDLRVPLVMSEPGGGHSQDYKLHPRNPHFKAVIRPHDFITDMQK